MVQFMVLASCGVVDSCVDKLRCCVVVYEPLLHRVFTAVALN